MRAQIWVSCASQNNFPHESMKGFLCTLALVADTACRRMWSSLEPQQGAIPELGDVITATASKRSLVAPWVAQASWCWLQSQPPNLSPGSVMVRLSGTLLLSLLTSPGLPRPQLCELCAIGSCWPSRICTEAELWQLASPLNIEVRGVAAEAPRCRAAREQAAC